MTAAGEAGMTISLTKSLSYCGVSRTAWYYARRPRNPAIDGRMESPIMEVAKTRPVRLPGSGLRAATALAIDMIAACLVARVSNANPSHCLKTSRTLKA